MVYPVIIATTVPTTTAIIKTFHISSSSTGPVKGISLALITKNLGWKM